jgi:acetate kinase
MTMRILVLNPGSSTLKYCLLDTSGEEVEKLADGLVDRFTGDSTTRAAADVIARCDGQRIDAVGCRIVHGGEHFREPALVTPAVLATIRDLGRLAPLHNPIAASVLEALTRTLQGVSVVAVFDTAFHATIPDVAALYALPLALAREKGLRRYGFHGTSHRYVSSRLLARLGRVAPTRLVTCHLGNGASLAAVCDGKCIDTSMGLTPLEGLVMGTRSGDVDPGLLLHLLREEGYSADALDKLLNNQSGLLGLAGSGDVRELTKAAEAGDARATFALEVFAYRARKYIGAYAAALEGLDAIAFTAGIGEHSALVRKKICAGLGWLGVRLDEGVNEKPGRGEVCISAAGSPVGVWIIPTDEETQIARETMMLLEPSLSRSSENGAGSHP